MLEGTEAAFGDEVPRIVRGAANACTLPDSYCPSSSSFRSAWTMAPNKDSFARGLARAMPHAGSISHKAAPMPTASAIACSQPYRKLEDQATVTYRSVTTRGVYVTCRNSTIGGCGSLLLLKRIHRHGRLSELTSSGGVKTDCRSDRLNRYDLDHNFPITTCPDPRNQFAADTLLVGRRRALVQPAKPIGPIRDEPSLLS